jgi:phosphonatase-like hydrolase
MIKMVVFDMAGTTVNENMVVYKTLQRAINEAGYDFTLDQVLAQGAGKEKVQAIKDVLKTYAGREDVALTESIYQKFIPLLTKGYEEMAITPMPGAEELFRALQKKGILVVLNTGYNGETARMLIHKLGWTEGMTIDALVTASDVPNNRPKPDMILLAMEKFGIMDGGEVIKVGDSVIDIEEGDNAGCYLSVGVTTGAHTATQLKEAKPGLIINGLMELLAVVEKANVAMAN